MKTLLFSIINCYITFNVLCQTKFITNENSIVVYKQDIQTILSNNTTFKSFNYSIVNNMSRYGNGTYRPDEITQQFEGIQVLQDRKFYSITKTIDDEYVKKYLKRKERKELEKDEKINNTSSLINNEFEFAILLTLIHKENYPVSLNASGHKAIFANDYDYAIYKRDGKEIYLFKNSPKIPIYKIMELSDLLGKENKLAFENMLNTFDSNNIVKSSHDYGSDDNVYKTFTKFMTNFSHIPSIKSIIISNNFKFYDSFITNLISGTRDWYDDKSSDEVRTTFIRTYKDIIGTATVLQSNAEIESLIRKYSNEYNCSGMLKVYPKKIDFVKKIYVEKFWNEVQEWPVYSVQKNRISELYSCFPDLKDNKSFNDRIEQMRMSELNAIVRRAEEKQKYETSYDSNSNSSDNEAKAIENSNYENVKAPTYEMTNCKEDVGLLDGKYTECKVKYSDGKEGYIYRGKMSGKYFFETSLMDGHRNVYYKNLESCINALYVYKKYKKEIEKDRTY